MNIFEEIERNQTEIANKFATAPTMEQKEKYAAAMKDIAKRFPPLYRDYQEERAFLHLSGKESSVRLNRILSKAIVLRDQYMSQETLLRKTIEIKEKEYDQFKKFCSDRIRRRVDGFTEVTGEKVSGKEIYKCYRRWIDVTNQSKRMKLDQILHFCDEMFGDSKGKMVYEHIRVFLEEEDVEEFDRSHGENNQ